MSSEISRIERCTARFFSWAEIVRPNARPASETTMPMASRALPDMPRNCTDERSGRTRFASPPPCSDAARVRDDKMLERFMFGLLPRRGGQGGKARNGPNARISEGRDSSGAVAGGQEAEGMPGSDRAGGASTPARLASHPCPAGASVVDKKGSYCTFLAAIAV